MKRREVEMVLLKSFEYWKSILGNEIDLGEVQELTEYIWGSIKEDAEIDAAIDRVYVISRSNIQRLVAKGKTRFTDIYGNRIVLRFEDCGDAPCVLESGTLYLTKEHFNKLEEEKKKRFFNDKKEENMLREKQTCLDDFMNPQKDKKERKNRRANDL